MRITLVSPFDPFPRQDDTAGAHVGGVERVYAETANGLARRGHDVTVLCSSRDAPSEETQNGFRIVRRPRRFTVMRTPLANLAAALPGDSEIVQVAATYPFTTPPILRRAHALDMRSVLDFHFEPAPGTWLGRIAAWTYRRSGPRSYPLADVVLVRSRSYAEASPSLARVPATHWRIVPNGIDVDRFHPDGSTSPGDYVLFVGRLVPYKGVDVLLRAYRQLGHALPLVIVGDGPQRRRLQSLARKTGVDARFLGRVADDDLPRLYRHARVTVLPSTTAQEAFGITLLESMACGTPVVASNLPGVAELARLGGLVVPPRDANALAQGLREAVQPGRLSRGTALADPIRFQYSWDAVAQRLLGVYTELVASPPARHAALPAPEVTDPAHPRRHPLL